MKTLTHPHFGTLAAPLSAIGVRIGQNNAPENGWRPCLEIPGATVEVNPTFEVELLRCAFNVTELAHSRGFSLRQFERLFGREFHCGPGRLVRGVRMALALARVVSEERVKKIAFGLGYGSAAHFSRAFAAHFGSSPREVGRKLVQSGRT